MEMKRLEIDNSAEAAVKSGRWKNPGSSFYYKILNSFRILDESKDDEDVDKYDFDFKKVLKEAYLIAPVEKIKNSPYGITPYSQSGCKYPHHVIKNGKLVVSVPGIQAAYARAKQQGIFKGDVKSHIEKHYKELGLDMSTMTECVDPIQEEIDLNFDFIQKHIESTLGVKFVHDDVMMESVDDIVDKEQYIKETFDWMDEILYESDDEYNRKIDEENEFDQRYLGLLNYENTVQEIRDELSVKQMMPLDWSIAGIKEMLESYAIYEKSHGSLKYEYRMGVDIDTGKLVCIQFKLEPDRIQQIGNRTTVLDALYHQNSDYRQKIKNINALIMNASVNGNVVLVDKYNKERKRIEDEAYQKFNDDNLPEFKKSIRKLGNIDYTAGEGIVDKIFYYQDGSTNKVRMIPTLSPELEEFLRTISRTYGDELAQYKKQTPKEYTNDPDAFTISYTKLFGSPKYQFVFKTYAKSKGLCGETYEVGKPAGESKYRSTKIMWDNLWMYQKFTASPALRGRLTNNTIVYDPMRYTGMNRPKVESSDGFITVNPNDGIELRENTWNHFMKLINDSENEFELAKSSSNYLELVESIDEDTDFSDKDIISLIEEYALFVERNSLLKHEYRMGIDINNGRLVAIEFDLDPNRIVKVGNQVAFNNANSYSADPINHFLAFLQNKRDSAKTEKERDSWNRQINDVENKIYQQKSDKALDELKKTIKHTGHIDYVSKGGKVTNIFYYDGTGSGKHTKGPITMIPVLSSKLNGFISYLDSMNPAYLAYQKNPKQGYNILNDRFIKHRQTNPSNYNYKNKYIYSLTSLFTDPEIQKLFVKYVKDNHINGETYQVGESYPNDERFKTTKILWDALWMYRKFTYNPVFRGTIPTYELENNTKNASRYNGLNKPREAKKKKPIKESNTELFDSIYEALYPLDPRSYEAMSSLIYDDYLEALELHGIDVSTILNSKLPEDINLISEITSNIDWLISNKSNQFNIDLSSYLEADDQSEENDQVEDDDTPPNIDLGDEEIESDEPPTIDTDEPESTEEDTTSEDEVQEDTSDAPDIIEPTSLPKATDAQEENKNGVRRKKLYIAFIEWAKSFNQKNTFSSIFDKDAFDVTYSFVPHEMRYFYRLANPILCVLSGSLTFFQVSELRKLNANNPDMKDALIFAATENDYRVFSIRDKKVYVGVDKEDGSGIAFTKCLADSFDLYIQNMIDQGDILNGPIASESDSNTTDENNDSDKE